MRAMRAAGYETGELPEDGDALIRLLSEGVTNKTGEGRIVRETLSLSEYKGFFESLPKVIQDKVTERWGGAGELILSSKANLSRCRSCALEIS